MGGKGGMLEMLRRAVRSKDKGGGRAKTQACSEEIVEFRLAAAEMVSRPLSSKNVCHRGMCCQLDFHGSGFREPIPIPTFLAV